MTMGAIRQAGHPQDVAEQRDYVARGQDHVAYRDVELLRPAQAQRIVGAGDVHRLDLRHPQAQSLQATLAALHFDGPVDLREGQAAIAARIDSPRGIIVLD